tara:strand:+ start:451 stop:639 length:189 start_codon:yes stop_codon:yes gene_type:complete
MAGGSSAQYKYRKGKWGEDKSKAQKYKTQKGALNYIKSVEDLIKSNDQKSFIAFQVEKVNEV